MKDVQNGEVKEETSEGLNGLILVLLGSLQHLWANIDKSPIMEAGSNIL